MQLYGGSFNLIRNGLPKIGIDATMVDILDTSQIQKALRPNTKLVWFELCTNPHIMVADLRKIVNLIKSYNSEIIIGVDNTFLSPWTVVSTVTKYCMYLYMYVFYMFFSKIFGSFFSFIVGGSNVKKILA